MLNFRPMDTRTHARTRLFVNYDSFLVIIHRATSGPSRFVFFSLSRQKPHYLVIVIREPSQILIVTKRKKRKEQKKTRANVTITIVIRGFSSPFVLYSPSETFLSPRGGLEKPTKYSRILVFGVLKEKKKQTNIYKFYPLRTRSVL